MTILTVPISLEYGRMPAWCCAGTLEYYIDGQEEISHLPSCICDPTALAALEGKPLILLELMTILMVTEAVTGYCRAEDIRKRVLAVLEGRQMVSFGTLQKY